MKHPHQWYFDDSSGKYIVVHLAMDAITPFLQRVLRRQTLENGESDGRYPPVSSYDVFIDHQLLLGYVVLMFPDDIPSDSLDSYSRRLRRRYQVINNISLDQLKALASPKTRRLCHMPPGVYPASYQDTTNGVILWLMKNDGDQAGSSPSGSMEDARTT